MPTKQIQERITRGNIHKLNTQQRAFVFNLMNDPNWNTKEAARKAGYKNPASAVQKLLLHPEVNKMLAAETKKRNDRVRASADDVLKELVYIGMRDPLDLCDSEGKIITDDLSKIPERMRRCIDQFKLRNIYGENGELVGQQIELRLAPKLQAIELLMKHMGMLQPTQEVTGSTLNWDELYAKTQDPIEQKLLAMEASVCPPNELISS